jgi:acid stress-induced BolA-like protein IbaG/YrbA
MDLKEKVMKALFRALNPEYVRLEDDDGISGFVVSRRFEGMSTLDRQAKIEETIQQVPLAKEERRRILMIAGLTPVEYEAVGARIRVHKVKELTGGAVEIVLHGGHSDAEYVRGALNNLKGVRTTDPKQVNCATGVLMSFRAKGSEATPLTKDRVIRALRNDEYIEVMTDA